MPFPAIACMQWIRAGHRHVCVCVRPTRKKMEENLQLNIRKPRTAEGRACTILCRMSTPRIDRYPNLKRKSASNLFFFIWEIYWLLQNPFDLRKSATDMREEQTNEVSFASNERTNGYEGLAGRTHKKHAQIMLKATGSSRTRLVKRIWLDAELPYMSAL